MRVDMGTLPPLPHARGNAMSRKIVQVNFHFEVASLELNAQLLPSLKAKYRLDKVQSSGTTGEAADWKGEINKHEVKVTVCGKDVPEVFTIGLPKVSVNGKYNIVQNAEGAPNTAKQLHYREGGYLDVIITLGHVEYNFTTDLLNQILFAEQSFRSELSLLVSRLKSSRPIPFAPGPPDVSPQVVKPLLYCLKVVGSGAPWFQLTASTPTSTAVRLTLDNLHATLTNKWVVKEIEGKERVFGAVEIQLSAKLGQLFKPAQFNEVAYELQEYASFMTQIRVENKEGTANSTYSYVIALNRPILLIKSTAFDKAILLWLNYKNTYDYWRAERSKAERERMVSQGKRKNISMFSPQPSTSQQEVDVNLSLAIHNGMYICMPLVGPEISDGMAALVVSLAKSDVTVGVKKELACEAGFESFKVAFVDNYDEQSLSDTFFKTTGSDSNFFYFPEGRYQFCSQASSVTGDAEWVLSVRSQMEGMKIDLDQRIGKLTKLLVNTFSSLGDDEDDWMDECGQASNYSESDFGEEEVNQLPDAQELKNIQQPQDKIRWLEKKMHEQSVRVALMVQDKAKEGEVEKERKMLRQLELLRFKQFRRSMIEKIRRNRAGAGYKKTTLRDNKDSRDSTSGRMMKGKEHDGQLSSNQPFTSQQNTQIGGGRQQDTVNMNIDVQVNIASGSCVLRTAPKEKEQGLPVGMLKRPSAKDLRKGYGLQTPPVLETNFSIPSVDLKGYYLSQDRQCGPHVSTITENLSNSEKKIDTKMKLVENTAVVNKTQSSDEFSEKNKKELVRKPTPLGNRMSNASGKESSKRGCFYLSVALASMPQETLVTPHLADFVEQVLEPLPPSSMFRSSSTETLVNSVSTNGEDAGMVPIVAIDTSVLPLDVIFNLTVQSSAVRFAGMQQRSSAADCLLKLPCLTLMASTRKMDGAEYLGGVDISVTLSAFSLSIFSPHQQATSHDALSLTLDHLSFVVSRSKNSSQETDNKVRFVLTANVGAASFNYDMRRLNELIAFPKPWYRAAIMRRVFFGDQSVKPRTPTMNSRPSSRVSPMPLRAHRDGEKAWSATVLVIVQWKELNVFAQMSNTMGNTTWKARNGVLRGLAKLNSKMERDASVTFKLQSSELNAHGGAISGQIAISQLTVGAKHVKKNEQPPRNTASAKLSSISARVEWMSRAVLIAKCTHPSISLKDEWLEVRDQTTGQINRGSVNLSVEGRWEDLQLVITKVTVDDMIKIANKLTTFFEEQLRSSKMVWGVWEASSNSSASTPEKPKEVKRGTEAVVWEKVLDLLTTIQMHEKLMHLPKASNAETIVGGSIIFEAGRISLACMHGEMNASSWALFHMRQPHILFTPTAAFAFLDEQNTQVGVSMKQKLILRLGPDIPIMHKKEELATVCRVQQSRSTVMRQNSSIDSCLDYVIGEVLDQLRALSTENKTKRTSIDPPKPLSSHETHRNSVDGRREVRGAHNVLELFQFPGLQAVLTSVQMVPCQDVPISPIDPYTPEVHSSFVCDFHSAVAIQTDFSAQVSFLPELLKSYMKNQDSAPTQTSAHSITVPSDVSKDVRVYKCEQWEVNPRIAFIERSNLPKWSPPLIDEILRKLQIFDHRTTIPKALQRGVLDPLDVCLAIALKQLLEMAAKE